MRTSKTTPCTNAGRLLSCLIFCLFFNIFIIDSVLAQCVTDGFEGPSINPCWTVVQTCGTATLSTEQSHSGLQSLKLVQTCVSGFACGVIQTLPTLKKGKVTVWLYDANPSGADASAGLLVLNFSPFDGFALGTEDWGGGFYYAFHYEGSIPCTITPRHTIPRTLGWHKLEIDVGSSSAELYIDDVLAGSCTGDFGFDRIQLSLNGSMYSPLPTYYFDDFSMEILETAAIPTLSEWGLIIFSLLLLGTIVWYLRRRRMAPAALGIFLMVFALSFYFSSTL